MQTEKSLVVVVVFDMCADDIRSFHMVKDSGFKAYTQTILDISVNSLCGLNFVELLLAPNTVSQNIIDRVAQGCNTVSIEILKHVESSIKMANQYAIEAHNVKFELAQYFFHNVKDSDNIIKEHGLLFWWKTQQTSFLIISRVVCFVLAITPSNAKSKCNFSDVGNTMIKKQNRLNPSKVDDLMFLQSMFLSRQSHH
ncbi:hypothetical protein AXG93_4720s1100 [Marchantia polymorpha subsp. ruderalis]|uniref:HAT C-terminal dimerisation domain-containing protein n=1 Tax=Marchantia polymorpha subsp. ruderalis TaxID=1480154 RepID=A0A176VU24_MARPO|nr:hypothetical protein AXG93_4720s1100 [Marchantia polymorpha subsp. ruderalis]